MMDQFDMITLNVGQYSEELKMKFLVRRYYSGFCTYEVEAENEADAYNIAVNLPVDEGEILSTLEDWRYADEVKIAEDDEN